MVYHKNEMRQQLVLVKFLVIMITLLFALPLSECNAQRNATRKLEKETFGRSRKGKAADEGRAYGKAAKAMKEQKKKEARRDREDEKQLKQLKAHHYEIQSEDTRVRMGNNNKNTEARYKAKRQKQRKEQVKPELKKPGQPRPAKDRARVKTKDPGKQPVLKQQKDKAKSKMEDPKKQPRLKQHKIKKY